MFREFRLHRGVSLPFAHRRNHHLYGIQGMGSRGGVEVVALLILYCLDSVTKTNLSVHEDKNRVPFVKVRVGMGAPRWG